MNHKNIVRIFSAHLYEHSLSGILILDAIIENNALERFLPNASRLSSIMITGGYRYRPDVKVDMEILKTFRRWFASLPIKKKSFVFSSLRSRLDNVKVETPLDASPF